MVATSRAFFYLVLESWVTFGLTKILRLFSLSADRRPARGVSARLLRLVPVRRGRMIFRKPRASHAIEFFTQGSRSILTLVDAAALQFRDDQLDEI